MTVSVFKEDEISHALGQIEEWFPEEHQSIEHHRESILRNIRDMTDPEPDSALLTVTFGAARADEQDLPETQTFSPCVIACGVCAVNGAAFAVGLLGLRIANQKRLAELLPRQMGPSALRGLHSVINDFKNAPGAFAKARALFSIVSGVYTAGGFKAVFKVLKEQMSWWEWLKTGVSMVAQIVAWVATAGAAFIAIAALTVLSAIALVESAIDAVRKCLMSSTDAVGDAIPAPT